ncbi:hypothetical protein TNCV_4840501 [Trichonephila clavipes]|nr:hypothetical protein TNCV_4840501 [Trichonephila clavipes]
MNVYKCRVPLRHEGTLNSRRAASPLVRKGDENEETELIRSDLAHYVGTSIDKDLREQICINWAHVNQKVISIKMPREGAFHHHIIVSYPGQDRRSNGNGCAIQHDFVLLTVRYVGFSVIEQIHCWTIAKDG